ncbi:RNA polymerase sigma factor [Actinoplanes subglobosus]|uniref:RNA polymerase sigma factor n=1 Tax=Actinoplanes subglobosus TaxID=1547892 RepID=A0ABV8IUV6_9ACTN
MVDRFRAGDQDAFAVLYRRYQPRVLAFVGRRVRDAHLAEDLTADTFVKAVTALPRLQVCGDDLGGWFTTIARHVVSDHYRAADARPVDLLPDRDFGVVDKTSAEDAAVQRDQWRRLLTAIQGLTPRQRSVVVHRLLLERTSEQTAESLGCGEQNVRHILGRARQQLTGLLRMEGVAA